MANIIAVSATVSAIDKGVLPMLVLSRKIGESLRIGEDIELIILDVNRGQVRIGIDAPKTTNIVRSELLTRAAGEQTNDGPKFEDAAPQRPRHYLQRNRHR
jgi:carbon storage regulator